MAVSKYRDIAELGAPPSAASATENLRAAVEVSDVCQRLSSWRPHRGVHRYPSVDVLPEASDDAR